MNSYRENLYCKKIVGQIVSLVKKIKSGKFTKKDFKDCERLTSHLQKFIDKYEELDSLDKWLAQETIEMSKYTCNRYAHNSSSDKIEI